VNADFNVRRAAARARLDATDPHRAAGGKDADPLRRAWFETVYAQAQGDPAAVPWAQLSPHPLLTDWLSLQKAFAGARALDVGCGLGDNAEALCAAGAQVVAFDLVAEAISWTTRRFPKSGVTYRVANLFEPPDEWRSAFDLVHECYTLQALPEIMLPGAARSLASCVAPNGRLLVIARARNDGQEAEGPPWPLSRSRIDMLAVDGLRLETLEDIPADEVRARHWRAVYRRTSEVATTV
jgi:2-polyprenyl-3-methyl-5-hydroxy-6-metoxy-1,4-benzoquinol methylase